MTLHHKSRIARLPQAVREQINQMLREGAYDAAIIRKLAEGGIALGSRSIFSWRAGGYQDWLKEQGGLKEPLSSGVETVSATNERTGPGIPEAGLEVAGRQLYKLLHEFDPEALKEKLAGEPAQYARLIQALARLSEVALKFESFRTEAAERQARKEQDLENPNSGGITPETLRRIEQELNLL